MKENSISFEKGKRRILEKSKEYEGTITIYIFKKGEEINCTLRRYYIPDEDVLLWLNGAFLDITSKMQQKRIEVNIYDLLDIEFEIDFFLSKKDDSVFFYEIEPAVENEKLAFLLLIAMDVCN